MLTGKLTGTIETRGVWRRTWFQSLRDDAILNLAGQLLQISNLLLALLALMPHLLEDLLHRQSAFEIGVHVLLLDGESSLDRLLSGPILAVRLPLHEDGLGLHAAIPTEPDGFGPLGLLQPAHIELPCVGIVIIDGRDGRILRVEFLAGVEDENGKMLAPRQACTRASPSAAKEGSTHTFKTINLSSVILSGCTQYLVVSRTKFC